MHTIIIIVSLKDFVMAYIITGISPINGPINGITFPIPIISANNELYSSFKKKNIM